MSVLTSPEFWTGIVSAIGAVTALVISFRTRNAVTAITKPAPPASTATPSDATSPASSPVTRHDDASNPWR